MISGSREITQIRDGFLSFELADEAASGTLVDQTRTSATSRVLPMMSRPSFDLGSEPQLRAAAAEVNHGAGHLVVARLVLADGIAVCKAKELSHALGVNEVVDVDLAAHAMTIHPAAAEPYGRTFPSDASGTFHA
jgi:hypothetical protein